MNKVNVWRPDLAGYSGPKYQAIADALADAVTRGELKAGDRLPAQRELAKLLGFDLTTVTRAYDCARQRGLIVARGSAGSFVREVAKATIAAAQQIDTGMNTPPIPTGGELQRAISDALQAVISSDDVSDLSYQNVGGSFHARRSGAMLLSRLGLDTEPEQVVITAGGQNALHAVMAALVSKGDRIACGLFVYPGFRAIAQRMGVELVPLPKMTGDDLRNACRERKITALYLVPTNDNPTTSTIEVGEREQIARAAQDEGVKIIEDDAYGLLPLKPLRPVSSFAPELSWYVLSISKVISPALRIAFVRAPGVGQALQLAADVHETAVMAPPLNAAIVAHWLQDQTFDRIIAATRTEANWRMQLAKSELKDATFQYHHDGYHLWLQLHGGVNANELSHSLALAGVGSIPSNRFAISPTSEQALRVSLGGAADQESLANALRMLAGHLSISLERWAALV